MVGNRNSRGEEGVVIKGNREKKSINTRGPAIGGAGNIGEVEESVGVMRRIIEFEMRLEVGPGI